VEVGYRGDAEFCNGLIAAAQEAKISTQKRALN
jgi:hypothetical protein